MSPTMASHFKFLPFLLLAMGTLSASSQVFWSVNCGSSDLYTDGNFIPWTPDDDLISNGEAETVQSSNSFDNPVLDTLRVFTTRKKNCYSTQVSKGEKVLVRVTFYYGNYDGKSNPPTFDLHFDGNYWATVKTSSTDLLVYEATYVAKGESVSVCVAQTKPNQFPFMTSLEVRGMDSDVYTHSDATRVLFLKQRFAFAATEAIRFANDPYDRIWVPAPAKAGYINVSNDAILISLKAPNNPPQGILENAITADDTVTSMTLDTIFPTTRTPVYIIMYFSEVQQLDATQKRSFRVYANNQPSAVPVEPPYGDVVEFYVSNLTADSTTKFSLVSTTDSTLPPLINAMEVFYIGGTLTDGTNNDDVAALVLLQETFDVLGGWTGDPCLPASYSWDWLNCSSDDTPRVTSLYLDSFDLSGPLPDISSMAALEIIDLHTNSLTGEIPDFLGKLPNLKQLNLAGNQFSGTIPTSLTKNRNLKLTVSGNPSLCTSGKSCSSSSSGSGDSSSGIGDSSSGSTVTSKKKSSSLPIILGTTIPGFFVIWVTAGIFVILRRRRNPGAPAGGGHVVGGANGKPQGNNMLHEIGQEMTHEAADNVVQQIIGSPSPLLDSSAQTSDQRGQVRDRYP